MLQIFLLFSLGELLQLMDQVLTEGIFLLGI